MQISFCRCWKSSQKIKLIWLAQKISKSPIKPGLTLQENQAKTNPDGKINWNDMSTGFKFHNRLYLDVKISHVLNDTPPDIRPPIK